MTELIVLGTIPGTNIQIDFTFWIYLSIGVVCFGILLECWHHRRALERWLAIYVFAYILSRSPIRPRQTA
ncbi:MAG: hypothetical protein JWM37_894 [Candidatus Saccharibacteria bacterium]|nr:hypothetical protein [Candidatus Saccharibacteria bacterium]